MQANDKFLKATFNRYLIPTMLSVLGGTVNIFFDGILVGQRLGEDGLAAVSLCMPIYLILCTLGSCLASGASILSAKGIGSNDMESSDRIYNMSFRLMLLSAVILTAVGLLFINPFAKLLSQGSNNLYGMVRSFAGITLAGSLPNMLLYIPFYYLRLDGKNRQVSYAMLIMAGLNILLDIIFLYLFDLGIAGAAYASVLSTAAACIIGFKALGSADSNFKIKRRLQKEKLLPIIINGSPAAFNNLFSALRLLLLNTILLIAAGNTYVSVFAVVNSLSEFSLCIVNGIPQTASPIIGIYIAERSNGGIRILMKRQIYTGAVLITIFGFAAAFMSESIGRLFGVSADMKLPLICLAVSLIIAQVNSIMTYYYNCIGHILLANIITAGRILVFAVSFAVALTIHPQALWLFLPLSELATFILWVITALMISGRNPELSGILLLDDNLTRTGKVIDFSINATNEDICNASERITDFCTRNEMSPKQTMRISLAVEEIITVMVQKCFQGIGSNSVDVRVFKELDTVGIRVRCGGMKFNPLLYADEEDELGDTMGIKMITRMSKLVKYQCTFGVNCVLILI